MCLCEAKYQGGGIAPFWGSATLRLTVSRDMGYRSDSIVISRDMGPLRILVQASFFLTLQKAQGHREATSTETRELQHGLPFTANPWLL